MNDECQSVYSLMKRELCKRVLMPAFMIKAVTSIKRAHTKPVSFSICEFIGVYIEDVEESRWTELKTKQWKTKNKCCKKLLDWTQTFRNN